MRNLSRVAVSACLVLTSLVAQRNAGRVLPADRPLHVVAFGDYGSGNSHQVAVARAIARQNALQHYDLGLTMGDNFYRCGVRSLTDPKWKRRWEDLYSPLGTPFYATLGNHDYGHPPIICPTEQRGSPEVEVAYTEHSNSWRMPARYYSFKAGSVLFVALDTEGWSVEQFQWVEETLAASASDPEIHWRIIYGHHPIYSSAVHLNERRIAVLRAQLMPVFIVHHVDLYICGHDHDLEHLKAHGIEFLICGGGGARLGRFRRQDATSVFRALHYAFLDLNIEEHKLTAQFLNTELKSLENPPLIMTK